MSQAEEIKRLIEQANQGNWIPFGIIIGILSVVVFLLIYIYNMHQQSNIKKHDKTNDILEQLAKTQANTEILCERYGVRLDVNDREIKEIKHKISA